VTAPASLEAIGKQLGLTRERVRQIENRGPCASSRRTKTSPTPRKRQQEVGTTHGPGSHREPGPVCFIRGATVQHFTAPRRDPAPDLAHRASPAMLVVAAIWRLPASLLFPSEGGLVLGFVPGLPHFQLPPDVVLVAILPPLLYSSRVLHRASAIFARNLRPISFLAVGLVAATMCSVAVIAHAAVSGLSWAAAFTPRRDRLADRRARCNRRDPPRRAPLAAAVVAIIEGESLVKRRGSHSSSTRPPSRRRSQERSPSGALPGARS